MKAIIFDFDGLILDTESSDYESWQVLYAAHGRELPFDLWLGNLGTLNRIDLGEHLATLVDRPLDTVILHQQRRQHHHEMIAHLSVMPGVEEIIRQAKAMGIKLAVASSSPHSWVDTHLARLDLLDYFDCTACRDDVDGRAKPDPAVYLKALEKLGVAGHEAVALEDSLNGIRAAKAAGIFCVAVPGPLVRHLDFGAADCRVESLAELRLAEVYHRINV
jgi:HAD superfamily hydrolase (TIGR01509 family)